MPRLSDSMEEGTITTWLKSDGDQVERGEELATIETDKAEMVFEAETAGVLRILVAAGDSVAVGAPIAVLDAEGGASSNGASAGQPVSAEQQAPVPQQAPGQRASAGRPLAASPLARRVAADLGVDLAAVLGSGPHGRIFKRDVIAAGSAAASPPPPTPSPVQAATPAGTAKGTGALVELTRLQQTVARRMAESKATAPDFAVSVEVDMGELLELRRRLKETLDPAPTITDAIVRAVALTLAAHPRANATYKSDGAIELHGRINVGIAVAAEDALLVPVVGDADKLPLTALAQASRALAQRARAGKITPPELTGATFTVSNLGMFGTDSFAGIINPPQAAILCVGATRERPAVTADGSLQARPLAIFTLVSDHRILYGADAASFLDELRRRLESPLGLLS